MVRALCKLWLVVTLAAQARRLKKRAVQALPRGANVAIGALVRKEDPMKCLRCSTCGINWPLREDCRACPTCGGSCWPKRVEPDDTVITPEEADREKRLVEFEKYCEERDKRQLQEEADRLSAADSLYVDSILGG